jgi:ubiquinone/menaquinone biosynthesis C-methylase UbiE
MTEILARLWHRLIALGFKLLYNDLACLYDPISWIASWGRWRQWQRTAYLYLPSEGRILDAGCGPGHLLADLRANQRQAVGLDLSPAMLHLAQKALQRRGTAASLCRSRVQALPFSPCAFAAVISSFPTAYVYDPEWLFQVHRILVVGGRLIIVEKASFVDRSPGSHCLEKLYQLTGQRPLAPDLRDLLDRSGLPGKRETVEVDGSIVDLVVAVKQE